MLADRDAFGTGGASQSGAGPRTFIGSQPRSQSMLFPRQSSVLPLSLLTSLLVSTAFAQETLTQPLSNEMAEAIHKEGIKNSRVHSILRDMTGNIGHRLTGSDNFTLACEWAKGEFEKMGLDVELEEWDEWPTVWNRGKWVGRIVEPIELEMYVATEAWTAGTKGPQTAGFVAVPSADEGDAVEGVSGKWVLS